MGQRSLVGYSSIGSQRGIKYAAPGRELLEPPDVGRLTEDPPSASLETAWPCLDFGLWRKMEGRRRRGRQLPAAALRVCPRTPRPHEPVSETQECLWVLTAGLAKSCYRSCFLVWMFFVLNVLKNCFQVWLKHLFPCSPVTGRFPACLSSSPLQRGGLVGQRGAETCPRPASVLGCHGRLVYSCTLSSASGPRTQASLSTNLSIMSVRCLENPRDRGVW